MVSLIITTSLHPTQLNKIVSLPSLSQDTILEAKTAKALKDSWIQDYDSMEDDLPHNRKRKRSGSKGDSSVDDSNDSWTSSDESDSIIISGSEEESSNEEEVIEIY